MLDDIKNSTDLANLKERINNCSDEELAAAMEEEWLHGIIPDSGISDEDLARIKAEIHEQIGTRKQFTLKRVLKWTQIAAAIALPICMVIMGMMYKENRQYAAIPLTERMPFPTTVTNAISRSTSILSGSSSRFKDSMIASSFCSYSSFGRITLTVSIPEGICSKEISFSSNASSSFLQNPGSEFMQFFAMLTAAKFRRPAIPVIGTSCSGRSS